MDRRETHAMVPKDGEGGYERRHTAADGNKDGTHPEVQQGEGRGKHRTYQGRNQADRQGACQHGGSHLRLVQVHQGEVWGAASTTDGDSQFRHHLGCQGGGGKRETLHQPRGRLHRHWAEEGRVRMQLLGHRRRDTILQGRNVQGGAYCGQALRRRDGTQQGREEESGDNTHSHLPQE